MSVGAGSVDGAWPGLLARRWCVRDSGPSGRQTLIESCSTRRKRASSRIMSKRGSHQTPAAPNRRETIRARDTETRGLRRRCSPRRARGSAASLPARPPRRRARARLASARARPAPTRARQGDRRQVAPPRQTRPDRPFTVASSPNARPRAQARVSLFELGIEVDQRLHVRSRQIVLAAQIALPTERPDLDRETGLSRAAIVCSRIASSAAPNPVSSMSDNQWCASAFRGSRRIARRNAASGVVPATAKDVSPPSDVYAADDVSSSARARSALGARALDRVGNRHVAAASHDDPRIRESAPRVDGARVALGRAREVGDRALERRARALMPVMPALRDDARRGRNRVPVVAASPTLVET